MLCPLCLETFPSLSRGCQRLSLDLAKTFPVHKQTSILCLHAHKIHSRAHLLRVAGTFFPPLCLVQWQTSAIWPVRTEWAWGEWGIKELKLTISVRALSLKLTAKSIRQWISTSDHDRFLIIFFLPIHSFLLPVIAFKVTLSPKTIHVFLHSSRFLNLPQTLWHDNFPREEDHFWDHSAAHVFFWARAFPLECKTEGWKVKWKYGPIKQGAVGEI